MGVMVPEDNTFVSSSGGREKLGGGEREGNREGEGRRGREREGEGDGSW